MTELGDLNVVAAFADELLKRSAKIAIMSV